MMVPGANGLQDHYQATPSPAVVEARKDAALRIVLVEDEAPLRRIIARNLQMRGYAVEEAATGEAAIAALRAAPPALLLLDVNLPDMSGWDVLRAMPLDWCDRVPTVVLSAVAQNPKRLNEFCDVEFMHKPFPLDALLRLVADKLGGTSRLPSEEDR